MLFMNELINAKIYSYRLNICMKTHLPNELKIKESNILSEIQTTDA